MVMGRERSVQILSAWAEGGINIQPPVICPPEMGFPIHPVDARIFMQLDKDKPSSDARPSGTSNRYNQSHV